MSILTKRPLKFQQKISDDLPLDKLAENSPAGQKEVLLSKRKTVDDELEGFRLRKRDDDDLEQFRLRKRSENQPQEKQRHQNSNRVVRMSQQNFINNVNDVPNIFRLGK